LYIQPFLLPKSLCRSLKSVASGVIASSLLVVCAVAQSNPVPQVVGPPHPQAVAPGGGDFTLKVYGANFVPGAVVNWNRQPRTTTYISGHEVYATILANDIVSNTAGYITVTNPLPDGGPSSASWTLVEVHNPTTTLEPSGPTRYFYGDEPVPAVLAADFANRGVLDLAAALDDRIINVSLGDGFGTFSFASNATYVYHPLFGASSAGYGDFNGDGNLDLAYAALFGQRNGTTGVGVSLGNGNGTFQDGWQYISNGGEGNVDNLVVGDFNRDGKLDIVGGDGPGTWVFLGNGDGTFQAPASYSWGADLNLAAGDFNGDGILDILVPGISGQGYSNFPLAIAFGNGDGTFRTPVTFLTPNWGCGFAHSVLVSDFNGDGKLDIAFCTKTSIGILLGNGDGTFGKPTYYHVGGEDDFTFASGDFNSDGFTDLLVDRISTSELSIFLGNGDGTFQSKQRVKLPGPKNQGGEEGIVTGDFNSDGLLDFIFQLDAFGIGVYLQQ
jgi:hypothetical protein